MGHPAAMSRVVESVVWWAVLVGVWLTTLSTMNWQDLLVAAVLAVPCAIIATLVRQGYDGRWRLSSAWRLPLEIVRGIGALFSRRAGLRKIPVSRLRKGVKTVVVSASPGTVVLDDKDDALLVHALGDE
jgi:multisubunit Na+/H+ antiporter MnhE subunit